MKMVQPTDQETMPPSLHTERAYLDYSMYVINDRALPHIGDGLKPATANHLCHGRAGPTVRPSS